HPWQALTREKFATAVDFERAFRSRWTVDVILAAALVSLVKIFNGNFIAATRLLFALGRRGLVSARFGEVHAINRTPGAAVVCLGLASAAAVFLGESILVPISYAVFCLKKKRWTAACAAYCSM